MIASWCIQISLLLNSIQLTLSPATQTQVGNWFRSESSLIAEGAFFYSAFMNSGIYK